jgi:hypothetical protein
LIARPGPSPGNPFAFLADICFILNSGSTQTLYLDSINDVHNQQMSESANFPTRDAAPAGAGRPGA